jgi:Tol biopolymer transport system component
LSPILETALAVRRFCPSRGWRRRLLVALLPLLVGVAWLLLRPAPPLPAGLAGAIAFVSDRDGPPALYWRRLPRDRERRLTFGSEAVGEPAVSPDGTRVAFSMNGRIGAVAVATGDVRILTLGVDWKDAQPAWLPDGRRLVVSARPRAGEPAGLHLLDPAAEGITARSPLTRPRAGDDASPAPSPDGSHIVFVREEHLMRVDLADGRVRRLTGGFKRERSPRFLPSGKVVCAWSEGKRHGIDVVDPEGNAREPLVEGGAFYRTVAPSPDGRFLAATLSWDAGFRPLDALLGASREEVRLLDTSGRDLARIEGSRRHANHSPDWGR